MAIIKKPVQRPAQTAARTIDSGKALAFVGKAAVNQGPAASEEESEESKKPVLLRLWKSEIDQIEEAVERAAKKRPHSPHRYTRHAWIVEAIFEKIKREAH